MQHHILTDYYVSKVGKHCGSGTHAGGLWDGMDASGSGQVKTTGAGGCEYIALDAVPRLPCKSSYLGDERLFGSAT